MSRARILADYVSSGDELAATTIVANAALPKAGGVMTGAIITNSTFDGVDIATRDGILTSTTTTAGAALSKAGGAMTGTLTVGSDGTGHDVYFYGNSASSNLFWDEGNDRLTLNDSDLFVDQDDNYYAINVDCESGSYAAVNIKSKLGLHCESDLSGGWAAHFLRDITEAGSNPLVRITEENTAGTQPALQIRHDGTTDGQKIITALSDTTEVFSVTSNGIEIPGGTSGDERDALENTVGIVLRVKHASGAWYTNAPSAGVFSVDEKGGVTCGDRNDVWEANGNNLGQASMVCGNRDGDTTSHWACKSGNNILLNHDGTSSYWDLTGMNNHYIRFDGTTKIQISSTVHFPGNVTVAGNFVASGSTKTFKIDHPIKSMRRSHTLTHACIEGPKVDLIYRGKVDLENGEATVNIDTVSKMTEGTFEVLCDDVQNFTTNETGWDAVKGSVSGNILTISCEDPTSTATVSWMVIGERMDDGIRKSEATDIDGKLIPELLQDEEWKSQKLTAVLNEYNEEHPNKG